MKAIILDTETHTINGYPIEIAYGPCSFEQGVFKFDTNNLYDELFSCPEPISYGAMAVHHIIEEDLIGKPSYDTFRLPEFDYIIGHNINYDIEAIRKCGSDVPKKSICTLALARFVWPELESHTLSTLTYFISKDHFNTRVRLRNAHNAKWDIVFTGRLLEVIVNKHAIKDMNSLYLLSEQARVPSEMPFGKHKGIPLKQVPKDYIRWLLGSGEIDPYLRKALEAVV